MALTKPVLFAVIHVGSSSMGMSIVEYESIDRFKIIEQAHREVNFGEELFQFNRLSFQTIAEICRVLGGYKELMESYGVTEYRLYATSVVREAENRRSILDQIYIHTGMQVEVVDMPKEIYYKYFAVYFELSQRGRLQTDEAVLFLDITSGGVGVTIWQGGALLYQQNVHIGTLRVMESFKRNERSSLSFPGAVGEYLYSMLSPIQEEVQNFDVKYLVLSGEEAQLAAELMGAAGEERSRGPHYIDIEPSRFNTFFDSFNGVTATKLINRYGVPEYKANILMPTLIMYHEILKMVPVEQLRISQTKFIEGIIMYYGAERENHPYLYMMREQNLMLARSIASRYYSDVKHAGQIERLGLQIFDALREHSGLSERTGYLYRIAATLNDVGKHINLRNHSEHAYHIIMGSDIFGLSEREKQTVATVVYYHYKGMPVDGDAYFQSLTEIQKIVVAKLVAIIRIARSLDMSHRQKVSRIEIEVTPRELIIYAYAQQDMSLEKWYFEREADYFREIFGLEIKIEERR